MHRRLVSQVPSTLGLATSQNLFATTRFRTRQEAIDTLALKRRGLVRITPRLPTLLQSIKNAN